MSSLFSPFQLKDARLRNRIAVPPMCQYQAVDGFVTDWHLPHYAGMARGGAGLVIVEATAVSADGRISPGCLGLWRDEHQTGLAQLAAAIKSAGGPLVEKRAIEIDGHIKTLGDYPVRISLHPDVAATITVHVISV